jgi:hypothetical protein
MFRKTAQKFVDDKRAEKAARRAENIGRYQILSYMDTIGTDFAMHVNEYRKRQDGTSVSEMYDALSDLAGLLSELTRQHDFEIRGGSVERRGEPGYRSW